MSVDEIYHRIVDLLDHDEFEAQKTRRVRYTGANRAQYMEIVLFVCPECRHVSTLESHGNRISCRNCGYAAEVNGFGFFEPVGGPLHFPNLRRWNLWQVQYFEGLLDRAVQEERKNPILIEDEVRIREGYKSQPLEFRGLGRLSLTTDQLQLDASSGKGQSYSFRIADIEGINVQNSEFLEFYYAGSLYQLKILARGGNSYKWNLAVRHLQGLAKETLKRESRAR
jgi:1-acyl-sn-glycerol-3-phosphate acyltransferase